MPIIVSERTSDRFRELCLRDMHASEFSQLFYQKKTQYPCATRTLDDLKSSLGGMAKQQSGVRLEKTAQGAKIVLGGAPSPPFHVARGKLKTKRTEAITSRPLEVSEVPTAFFAAKQFGMHHLGTVFPR